jgi:hypothetical protein
MLVRRDGKGNIEFYNPVADNWDYWISEKDIQTRRGLIRMIQHLTEKNWISRLHIAELMDLAHKELRTF